MYKPLQIQAPQNGNAEKRSIAPPNISPPRGLYFEIALKYLYKVKQSKNGKFTSSYKASPIDFETKISLRRYVPPNISPSKNKPLQNISPGAYFRNFTVCRRKFSLPIVPRALFSLSLASLRHKRESFRSPWPNQYPWSKFCPCPDLKNPQLIILFRCVFKRRNCFFPCTFSFVLNYKILLRKCTYVLDYS